MRTIGESFIDVDSSQRAKAGQVVSGDVFLSRRIKSEGRIISILSDGLGSGVKASVLANLTATMALRKRRGVGAAGSVSSLADLTAWPLAGLAKNFPAIMHMRLYGMNANGKVYTMDAAFGLNK